MIRPEWQSRDEPRAVDDLTYEELVAMITAISDPQTEDEIRAYYINLINCTLPGAQVSDLIFWPNKWFEDERMLHADLTPNEIANYLLAWTETRLPGSEAIHLPTIPDSKRSGPPRVIFL